MKRRDFLKGVGATVAVAAIPINVLAEIKPTRCLEAPFPRVPGIIDTGLATIKREGDSIAYDYVS